MTAAIGFSPLSLPIKFQKEPSIEDLLYTLTSIQDTQSNQIIESFHLFAEMISDIDLPFKNTVFQQVNSFMAGSGGLTMCMGAWQRRSMDLERIYYLSRMERLLRVDILSKIDQKDLRTQEAKNLYFFLEEICQVATREELKPEKVHELSEFMETEYSNLQKELPLAVFLKTMQALNLFTSSSMGHLACMPLTSANAIRYWAAKMPPNEDLPRCEDLDKIMDHVRGHDFTRAVKEMRFEESRWKAFHSLNLLTEKQLLMWNSNGSVIHRNHAAIKHKMKRGSDRMIRVCAIDTKEMLEKEKKEGFFAKVALVIKRIFRFIAGARLHHPNFLTYSPEEQRYTIHGKKMGSGTYHDLVSGDPKKHVREYEINVAALMDRDGDLKDGKFETRFLDNLERIVRLRNSHLKTPNIFWLTWFAITPRFTATKPAEINLCDEKERAVSCNQYVIEAIIQAHVETCRELKAKIPESLAVYGFKKGDNVNAISPTYMMECLIRSGVLRECFSPFLR